LRTLTESPRFVKEKHADILQLIKSFEHSQVEESPIEGVTQMSSGAESLITSNVGSQDSLDQLQTSSMTTPNTSQEHHKLLHLTVSAIPLPTLPLTPGSSAPGVESCSPSYSDNLLTGKVMRSANRRPEAEVGNMHTHMATTLAPSRSQLDGAQISASNLVPLHQSTPSNIKLLDVEMYNEQTSMKMPMSDYWPAQASLSMDTTMMHYQPNLSNSGMMIPPRQSALSSSSDSGTPCLLYAFDDSWTQFCKDNNGRYGIGS
jgi:hypothetical protein